MATRGTLTSYLALCLQTLRGFWAREGEPVSRPRVLLPRQICKAQPSPPFPAWGFGIDTHVRGLQQTAAGMPTAALPDLIRSGKVKALFLHGGPMHSWPEPQATAEAFGKLDLLVMHDVELTATSALADYVIATRRQLEVPATSQPAEATGALHPGYSWTEPYGFYRPAVLPPPRGSDLLEAWQTYYRLAQRLGLSLSFIDWAAAGKAMPAVDMENEPTTDDLYELVSHGSAIPLSRVKQHPHGALFEEARDHVRPRDPDCTAKLQIGDPAMLAELREVRGEAPLARRRTSEEFPYLLITRRIQESTNTGLKVDGAKRAYNPAYMHPDDLAAVGLAHGDLAEIRSRHGRITGVVEVDPSLRPGVVAMTHGFGAPVRREAYDPRRHGANVNELISWSDDPDPFHGMPRMSAVPIVVRPTNLSGSEAPISDPAAAAR